MLSAESRCNVVLVFGGVLQKHKPLQTICVRTTAKVAGVVYSCSSHSGNFSKNMTDDSIWYFECYLNGIFPDWIGMDLNSSTNGVATTKTDWSGETLHAPFGKDPVSMHQLCGRRGTNQSTADSFIPSLNAVTTECNQTIPFIRASKPNFQRITNRRSRAPM